MLALCAGCSLRPGWHQDQKRSSPVTVIKLQAGTFTPTVAARWSDRFLMRCVLLCSDALQGPSHGQVLTALSLEAVCSVLALCEQSVPLPPTLNDAEATHRTIKHHLRNNQFGLTCHGSARLGTLTQHSGAKPARVSLDAYVS